jgi:catechol-2,3-dioxygenase
MSAAAEGAMIQLKRIGHVLLRVADLEQSRKFYSTILGFQVMEEDPEHGGLFMALEGHAHTLDLFPVQDAGAAPRSAPGGVGVHHVAFQVDSEGALGDAHRTLREHGVEIARAVDHVSQKSIYFHDPDGNLLEIYYELPNARQLFLEGRGDRDTPLVFAE